MSEGNEKGAEEAPPPAYEEAFHTQPAGSPVMAQAVPVGQPQSQMMQPQMMQPQTGPPGMLMQANPAMMQPQQPAMMQGQAAAQPMMMMQQPLPQQQQQQQQPMTMTNIAPNLAAAFPGADIATVRPSEPSDEGVPCIKYYPRRVPQALADVLTQAEWASCRAPLNEHITRVQACRTAGIVLMIIGFIVTIMTVAGIVILILGVSLMLMSQSAAMSSPVAQVSTTMHGGVIDVWVRRQSAHRGREGQSRTFLSLELQVDKNIIRRAKVGKGLAVAVPTPGSGAMTMVMTANPAPQQSAPPAQPMQPMMPAQPTGMPPQVGYGPTPNAYAPSTYGTPGYAPQPIGQQQQQQQQQPPQYAAAPPPQAPPSQPR